MPVNLEIKVLYPRLQRIYARLKKLQAVKTAILIQKDVYFTAQQGLLKLRIVNDHQEMIHYQRPENSAKRWSEYYVLPIIDKSSEKFFRGIFPVETVVQKRRVLYMYKNTRIHLDTVKGLGTFIELESVVKGSRKQAEKEFATVKSMLGLDDEVELRTSYRDLMLKGLPR
ncbi:MAG: class IV adenylate cyclase [Ignavibacteria bacterium]|nr:class IV adenylate cyclase [Ignavibacteria bacterium]